MTSPLLDRSPGLQCLNPQDRVLQACCLIVRFIEVRPIVQSLVQSVVYVVVDDLVGSFLGDDHCSVPMSSFLLCLFK